jgi:hypothetical protein
MIGYTELLAARLNGFAPVSVWVHVLDCEPSYYLKRDALEAIANGFRVSLLILPNESIAALDLSALTGLTANVMGQNTPRTHASIKRCLAYAESVIHCLDGHFTILRGTHETYA